MLSPIFSSSAAPAHSCLLVLSLLLFVLVMADFTGHVCLAKQYKSLFDSASIRLYGLPL